jgi:probable HAF family extracellular repeat protein
MKPFLLERFRPANLRAALRMFFLRTARAVCAAFAKLVCPPLLAVTAGTLLLTGGSIASAVSYRITDLGAFNEAAGINDAGEVVGTSYANNGFYAFRWTARGGVQIIGALSAGYGSFGDGINNSGQIVGESGARIGERAFRWTPTGGIQDLGGLPLHNSIARATNNVGAAAGERTINIAGAVHAVRWTAAGAILDLGTLNAKANYSSAYGINDAGEVVGTSYTDRYNAGPRAFLWTEDGGMQDLGTLGNAGGSEARGINNAGQVVGASGPHAFLWSSGGGMRDLGALSQPEGTRALAINDAGQVVGADGVGDGSSAFLWTAAGGMRDLNELVDPRDPLKASFKLGLAADINNRGQIVGWGIVPDPIYTRHAFLLTPAPIPEPSSWASVIVGLSLAAMMIRRRSSPPGPITLI